MTKKDIHLKSSALPDNKGPTAQEQEPKNQDNPLSCLILWAACDKENKCLTMDITEYKKIRNEKKRKVVFFLQLNRYKRSINLGQNFVREFLFGMEDQEMICAAD